MRKLPEIIHLKPTIHIGCSAFNNDYWKGIFYPEDLPRTKRFLFYAQHFSTYELNGTFYRMPTVKTLKTWHDMVADDFVFSVKANRNITHYKKFKDCSAAIAEFYAIVRDGLGKKLGCVLFQLPPSFAYSEENLRLILDGLDSSFSNVVEFRHESWWRADVFEALSLRGITFCGVSYPKLPQTLAATSNTGYVRLHGRPKLFYSGYTDAELRSLLAEIMAKKWEQVFVYFNNTADIHGIADALRFEEML